MVSEIEAAITALSEVEDINDLVEGWSDPVVIAVSEYATDGTLNAAAIADLCELINVARKEIFNWTKRPTIEPPPATTET